jgi:hypothetical protein
MNAIKTSYNSLPESIHIPKELISRKAEIIIILEDDTARDTNMTLESFYGSIPDFPSRENQGTFERREPL